MKILFCFSKNISYNKLEKNIPKNTSWLFLPFDKNYMPLYDFAKRKNIPLSIFLYTDNIDNLLKNVDKVVLCWDKSYDFTGEVYSLCSQKKLPVEIYLF